MSRSEANSFSIKAQLDKGRKTISLNWRCKVSNFPFLVWTSDPRINCTKPVVVQQTVVQLGIEMVCEFFFVTTSIKILWRHRRIGKKPQQTNRRTLGWFVGSFFFWFWVLILCLFWYEKVRMFLGKIESNLLINETLQTHRQEKRLQFDLQLEI